MIVSPCYCVIAVVLVPSFAAKHKPPDHIKPTLVREIPTTIADNEISGTVLSDCGESVVCVTRAGKVYFFKLKDGASWSTVTPYRRFAFPLGTSRKCSEVIIALVHGQGSLIGKVNARTGQVVQEVNLSITDSGLFLPGTQRSGEGDRIAGLCIPENKQVWIGVWDHSLREERHVVMTVPHSFSPDAISISPRANVAALAAGAKLFLWEIGTRCTQQTLLLFDDGDSVARMYFSPDGCYLAIAFSSGRLSVYCVKSAREINRTKVAPQRRIMINFSTDANWLFWAHSSGKITVYETITAKKIGEFSAHHSDLSEILPHPDGKRLITVGDQKPRIKIWAVPSLLNEQQPDRPPASMEQYWAWLCSEQPQVALKAAATLVSNHQSTIDLIRKKMNLTGLSKKQVAPLLVRLRHKRFSIREQATRDLRALGYMAEPFLQKAFKQETDRDARTRLSGLLDELAKGPRDNADATRVLRCVRILELIGNDDAEECLRIISKCHNAIIACAANAALQRLSKHTK